MERGNQPFGNLYRRKGEGYLAKQEGKAVVVDDEGHKSVNQLQIGKATQKNIKSEQGKHL